MNRKGVFVFLCALDILSHLTTRPFTVTKNSSNRIKVYQPVVFQGVPSPNTSVPRNSLDLCFGSLMKFHTLLLAA